MAVKGKSKTGTLCWILFLVVVAVMTALFLYPLYKNKNAKIAELQQHKKTEAVTQRERDIKASKVDALENSPEAVEAEARNKFGMGKPDETVYRYEK